jgi:hypothetical protein
VTKPALRIVGISVVIGVDEQRINLSQLRPVRLEVRQGPNVLAWKDVQMNNNKGTDFWLDQPIRMKEDETYSFRMVNTSGGVIGVYMIRVPNSKLTTIVEGALDVADGEVPDDETSAAVFATR